MAIQSATKETLKTFLSNIYYIPMNQREYSWEQAQLEDFWEDLKSVINNQDKKHFFGQIVIYDDTQKKKKYIIEAWAEVEYLEYRTYEIEAESEEDAKERFEEDGLIIDTIESDCDTHSVKFAKIYEGL